MKPPLRIAVLECDTPADGARQRYGGYGAIFKILLEAGADALGQPDVVSSKHGLQISAFDVVSEMEYPRHEDVDAVLLTGSKHDSFRSDPWIVKLVEYTKALLTEQKRVRVVGVCFGHQIIGRALGAGVGRSDLGWELSVTPMKLSDKGRELFKKEKLSLHQMHQDVVFEHPPTVMPLGDSLPCKTQGMYERGRLMSVQGHPEFNEVIERELLDTRVRQGKFSEDLYRDAIARVANHHDGVAVSAAFLRFLLEE